MVVYYVHNKINKIVFTRLIKSILSFTLKLNSLGDLLYQVRCIGDKHIAFP